MPGSTSVWSSGVFQMRALRRGALRVPMRREDCVTYS
jgi:hypothetical protein